MKRLLLSVGILALVAYAMTAPAGAQGSDSRLNHFEKVVNREIAEREARDKARREAEMAAKIAADPTADPILTARRPWCRGAFSWCSKNVYQPWDAKYAAAVARVKAGKPDADSVATAVRRKCFLQGLDDYLCDIEMAKAEAKAKAQARAKAADEEAAASVQLVTTEQSAKTTITLPSVRNPDAITPAVNSSGAVGAIPATTASAAVVTSAPLPPIQALMPPAQ